MAKLIAIASLLAMVSSTSAHAAEDAPEIPDAVLVAAEKASVDPVDLMGAVLTTKLEPMEYLYQVGELQRPPPDGWPIGGALGQRIFCIESIESHHGQAMYNHTPVWNGEHAQGWLGFLPSTAARWGAQIGNRASEWAGAARIIAQGERFARGQFYGLGAGIC